MPNVEVELVESKISMSEANEDSSKSSNSEVRKSIDWEYNILVQYLYEDKNKIKESYLNIKENMKFKRAKIKE